MRRLLGGQLTARYSFARGQHSASAWRNVRAPGGATSAIRRAEDRDRRVKGTHASSRMGLGVVHAKGRLLSWQYSVTEFRQQATIVAVAPRVEIPPVVGGDGVPSTP